MINRSPAQASQNSENQFKASSREVFIEALKTSFGEVISFVSRLLYSNTKESLFGGIELFEDAPGCLGSEVFSSVDKHIEAFIYSLCQKDRLVVNYLYYYYISREQSVRTSLVERVYNNPVEFRDVTFGAIYHLDDGNTVFESIFNNKFITKFGCRSEGGEIQSFSDYFSIGSENTFRKALYDVLIRLIETDRVNDFKVIYNLLKRLLEDQILVFGIYEHILEKAVQSPAPKILSWMCNNYESFRDFNRLNGALVNSYYRNYGQTASAPFHFIEALVLRAFCPQVGDMYIRKNDEMESMLLNPVEVGEQPFQAYLFTADYVAGHLSQISGMIGVCQSNPLGGMTQEERASGVTIFRVSKLKYMANEDGYSAVYPIFEPVPVGDLPESLLSFKRTAEETLARKDARCMPFNQQQMSPYLALKLVEICTGNMPHTIESRGKEENIQRLISMHQRELIAAQEAKNVEKVVYHRNQINALRAPRGRPNITAYIKDLRHDFIERLIVKLLRSRNGDNASNFIAHLTDSQKLAVIPVVVKEIVRNSDCTPSLLFNLRVFREGKSRVLQEDFLREYTKAINSPEIRAARENQDSQWMDALLRAPLTLENSDVAQFINKVDRQQRIVTSNFRSIMNTKFLQFKQQIIDNKFSHIERDVQEVSSSTKVASFEDSHQLKETIADHEMAMWVNKLKNMVLDLSELKIRLPDFAHLGEGFEGQDDHFIINISELINSEEENFPYRSILEGTVVKEWCNTVCFLDDRVDRAQAQLGQKVGKLENTKIEVGMSKSGNA